MLRLEHNISDIADPCAATYSLSTASLSFGAAPDPLTLQTAKFTQQHSPPLQHLHPPPAHSHGPVSKPKGPIPGGHITISYVTDAGEDKEILSHSLQAGRCHLAAEDCHLGHIKGQGRWMGRDRQKNATGSRTTCLTDFPTDQS